MSQRCPPHRCAPQQFTVHQTGASPRFRPGEDARLLDRGHLRPQPYRPGLRMSKKTLIWIGITVGSAVGGYLPALWGGDLISLASVMLSAAGGGVGIWLGYRFGE